jgi:glycosyltransferase involved in cell wall biosynthesis
MYQGKQIGVVIPAYNEEKLIGRVITTMPDFVDRMIVVDDASRDGTSAIVEGYQAQYGERLILIRHAQNRGVGGAIISGHHRALDEGMEVVAIMAGDAQMDPADLENILTPVVSGQAEYAKGNRFINGDAWRHMPRLRFYANAGLSMLNKIASGYWQIADPQCGYTAISAAALRRLDLGRISEGYHFENSILLHLNVTGLRVVDVPIRAVYGIGEKSGINHLWALASFSLYLLKAFFWRLREKYIIRDFHPLVFFYLFGLFFMPVGLLFGIYLVVYRLVAGPVEATSALFAMVMFLSGLQFLLFAMWFDKDNQGKG